MADRPGLPQWEEVTADQLQEGDTTYDGQIASLRSTSKMVTLTFIGGAVPLSMAKSTIVSRALPVAQEPAK